MKTQKGFFLALTILCALLPLAVARADSVTEVLLDTNTTWSGAMVAYLQTHYPRVRVQTSELAPGASTGWQRYAAPVYIYVLAGTVEMVTLDGRVRQWSEGQAFVADINAPHEGWNPGDEAARLLLVITGEEGAPFTTPYPEAE